MSAFCPTCDCLQEVEFVDETHSTVSCLVCGDEFTPSSSCQIDVYNNYAVGLVLTVDAIPKKSDLKRCTVDVTGDDSGNNITVVTNAKHIAPGWRVVVALENAIVPAGSRPEDSDVVVVKKTSVGGVKSEGMFCDAPMLGWAGGAKGVVQQVPEEFSVGCRPPASRPSTLTTTPK